MVVTWAEVSGIDEYQVFRVLGSDALDGGDLIGTVSDNLSYADTAYASVDQTQAVRYAVRSVYDGSFSAYSAFSNFSSKNVLAMQVGILQSNSKITLTWNRHGEATSYKVYRASRVDQADLTLAALIEDPVRTSWDDVKNAGASGVPIENIPYYYRVTWLRNGLEFGADRPLVLGVFSETSDLYEDNNDRESLAGQTGSTIFDAAKPPLLYNLSDGVGGYARDTDWYKYVGTDNSSVVVTITLPEDSLFSSGELKFRWYYKGSLFPSQDVDVKLGTPNSFIFTPTSEGAAEVYFRIAVSPGVLRDVVGKYFVTVSNDL